jgi:acyl-CoA reductase-like NAD-dependent aldehyde dehydrogenase
MWIGGQKVTTADKRTSTNPSRPSEVIGVVQHANAELARQAVEAAHKAFEAWKKVPFQERAKCLFRAAQIVRERKHELNALVCYEVGKSWAEADGDVAETVDFCEFYGREMLRLGEPQVLTPMRGERNYLTYIPLGVGAVIPPWNFPCAIMAGLVVASLVTGNTVVVKPAGDSPIIAAKFIDILFEAGIPKDAVQFITGPGSEIGDVVVQHPKTVADCSRGDRGPVDPPRIDGRTAGDRRRDQPGAVRAEVDDGWDGDPAARPGQTLRLGPKVDLRRGWRRSISRTVCRSRRRGGRSVCRARCARPA